MVGKLSQNRSRSAVVTGASQGIGKAIAVAMAQEGIHTTRASRSLEKLKSVRKEIGNCAAELKCIELKLANLSNVASFAADIHDQLPQLDILVNCAGVYDRGSMVDASTDHLYDLYKTNVRGVYALTRSLLPMLKKTRDDTVFINSTIVFSTAKNVGQYAAMQHASLSIANALRAEVNDDGVRVLTVYPGRTATPLQEKIFEIEEKDYRPQVLLQPSDVAEIVVACLKLPGTAEVTDLCIRPRQK
jgi:NADP-dependent 3-hydroxy acid dehydrogenase YdfG